MDNCADLPDEEWIFNRFTGHCYFYPDRDCPGWTPGGRCGRMGDQIPASARPADE